ncbi:uncharacterized protein [Typha latifolia]|uniref:uncharacterized protein n=1 Tax=Typha latifolia TaxID=4733 RepID=UPI003C2DEE8F
MNKPSKLERKTPATKKRNPSPRNPLTEINNGGSSEAPRGGCLSFLLSNSSSSKDSFPRAKSIARAPTSAPPNPRAPPSKNPRNASKVSQKKLESTKSMKSRAPDLLERWSRRKPSSGNLVTDAVDVRRGKSACPELRFEANGERPSFATTPERTLPGLSPLVELEGKEGETKFSVTPTSGTTPPIKASISPEVACGSLVAPTPVCFATGHVMTGVHDRRKCKPRGILTISGDEPESVEIQNARNDGSWSSSLPPLLAGASIHWLSSPSGNGNGDLGSSFSSNSRARSPHCAAEASVNWLLSPCEDGEDGEDKDDVAKEELVLPKSTPLGTKYSSDDVFWRFSPSEYGITKSAKLGGLLNLESSVLGTPSSGFSSGFGFEKTPSSNSSISPFSMIMKRVSASSAIKLPIVQQGERINRYAESSPLSEESWVHGIGNMSSTPPMSFSMLKKLGNLSGVELDSVAEGFETMRLSSKLEENDENGLSSLLGHSFQFGRLPTPLNSIDLSFFQKPISSRIPAEKEVCHKKQVSPSSETRISWREGLVSRIFEMGDLDCCQLLSDDEDEHALEEKRTMKFDHKLEPNDRITLSEDGGDQHATCAFGSFEFTCNESSPRPIPCAESISTEGLELISSDDSDWTLFYKNHLFEV